MGGGGREEKMKSNRRNVGDLACVCVKYIPLLLKLTFLLTCENVN